MSRRIRIASGRLGGRFVSAPEGIRPTASRVRESLMNIWAPRLVGARFLDLFAGSGAVAFEARSRGAARLVLVDSDRQVIEQLHESCRILDLDDVGVLKATLPRDSGQLSERLSGPFDLVFADPPYSFDLYPDLVQSVQDWLVPEGQVAIEHDGRHQLPEESETLRRVDRRRYGDSYLSIFAGKKVSDQD